MSRFTKLSHRAQVGSKKPALCGKRPPRGRAWKQAPPGHPDCQKCEERHAVLMARSGMWLAS